MQLVRRVDFELEPKQVEFIQSTADAIVYSGGFGGGKTLMVCANGFLRAQHPRAVEVLCRDTMKNVKDTILPTLFEGSGKTPAILHPGCYIWHKSEDAVRLLGPNNRPLGLIRYRGLGATHQKSLEKMTFRGQNVTGIGIDQMEEISRKQFNNALGRLRVDDDGLTRQLYGSCNPSAPSHWIAELFGITASHDPITTGRIDRDWVNPDGSITKLCAILTCPAENPHLPPDYLARLATYTGVERLRYVLGRWVASQGVVYDNFNRAHHEGRRSGPWARSLICIDDGTSKPAAILSLRVDFDGRRHYELEVHRAGMLNSEKVEHCRRIRSRSGDVEAVVVDPAAAALKADLRDAGFPVIDGKNDVLPGISVVRQGLALGLDGRPGITIDPGCTSTIKEIEGYMWDPNSNNDKVVKADDHGPDAIRYGEMHLYDPPALVFDSSGLQSVEARTRQQSPPLIGAITHEHPPGRQQDLALADGQVDDIQFEEQDGGPFRVWHELHKGRPPARDRFVIFAAAGDGQGGTPSVVVVADARLRTIVAQWTKATPPERLARLAAMLSLWYGAEDEPAPVGYLAGALSAPGLVFGQHLARLGGNADPWEASSGEFAEQIGLLRAAWEGGQMVERDPAVFSVARQYVFANATMMHACLVGSPERRGSHADLLIARAGLWRMLAHIRPEDLPEREAPMGSLEWHRRKRKAEEEGRGGITFG